MRLQDRDVTPGMLICNALPWFRKRYRAFGRDPLLWIGGSAASGMILGNWRDDLQAEAAAA